jgi:hypothetical protein
VAALLSERGRLARQRRVKGSLDCNLCAPHFNDAVEAAALRQKRDYWRRWASLKGNLIGTLLVACDIHQPAQNSEHEFRDFIPLTPC